MDRVAFGRTGHDSSRVLFGAAALGAMRQEKADQVLELLLAHGVNHIDTAASYGDSELRVGAWMARHRDRFFLATKTGDRTAEGARASIRRSLERLARRADRPHPAPQPGRRGRVGDGARPGRRARGAPRGARAGQVRFLGVTGHGTRAARDASPQPRALPVRLRPLPLQRDHVRRARVRGRRRGAGGALSGARRRDADHQGGCAQALAGRRAAALQLVRAPDRPRGHPPRRPLRAGAAGPLPQLVQRRHAAASASWTRPTNRSSRRLPTSWRPTSRGSRCSRSSSAACPTRSERCGPRPRPPPRRSCERETTSASTAGPRCPQSRRGRAAPGRRRRRAGRRRRS